MQRSDDANARDVACMCRFLAGDRGAYEELVRAHLAFVVRHARRYTKDEGSAEDIAQEVFLRLFRSAALFRDGRNFRGWLVTMTCRIALNELRTRRRKHWRPLSALGSAQESAPNAGEIDGAFVPWRPGDYEISEPPAELLRRESFELLHSAIARLPERQQVAIWLQRFEGWDLEQIGDAMELSVAAVKSLLFRARASLLEQLAPYLEESAAPSRGRP